MEKQSENEKIYNVDGMDIIVSEELDGAIKGAKIDYTDAFFRRGFEVQPLFS